MTRLTVVFAVVLALMLPAGVQLAPSGVSPSAESYESIQRKVTEAFDSNREHALRAEFLELEDRAVFSFGVALIDFYDRRLWASLQTRRAVLPPSPEVIRTRIKRCMMHDPSAAYPVALYAWFVDNYREKGLSEPQREFMGTTKVTSSDGKTSEVPVYKVIADPAKRARVEELLSQALELDKDNALAKYGIAANTDSPEDSARLLWSSIGEVGQYLWETDALWRINFRLPDDQESRKRVVQRVELLRAKIGKDSRRLRAYHL